MESYRVFKFRNLFKRFNGLVLLNMCGLALGLTSVIFIAVWVSHELSYDRFYDNAGRIYRVESLINLSGDPSVWKITPAPVAGSIVNDFPEVEDAVVLQKGYGRAIKADDRLFTADNLFFTDHSFFKLLSVKVISGDKSQLLTGPDEIILSRHAAEVLFGDNDPIGESVLFNNTDALKVTGVIENLPTNTHLKIDYLVPFSLLRKAGNDVDSWGRVDFITYILLKEKTDPVQFNEKLSGYWQTKIKGFSGTLFINPLTRLYLYRDPGLGAVKYPYNERAPITTVILFSVIGVVILLIACINFINLSIALASQRAKEIGVRKVNGAGKTNLVLQFLGESLLQTSLATVVAIFLAMTLLPVFARISGIEYDPAGLFSLNNVLIYPGLALFTGLIAGMYPALVLSSFDPVKVIKPMPHDVIQGSGLRRILVVIQFGLAFVFIVCVLVINRQIKFMQQNDLGFDKERVMVVYPHLKPEKIDVIAEQIEELPGVSNVALGGNIPVNMGNFSTFNRWDGNTDGRPLMFFMMQVDDKYLDLLDIELVQGRKFYKGTISPEVIVNEAAVKRMGMEDPIGKFIWRGEERYAIVGVVRDFHFHTLKDEIKPVFIYKNKAWWMKMIFIKIAPGDHFQTVGNIVDIIKKDAPGFPVNYIFLDQEIDKYYDNERRLSTLINAATVLTIVISCIGLFSLTAFSLRKKRKEIGIRKAYGATTPAVLIMVQKEFGRLVLLSSIISVPAGYYIMMQWLNSYASHVRLTPVYFLAAVLIIVMISTLPLLYHTVKAARMNPADTLKNE